MQSNAAPPVPAGVRLKHQTQLSGGSMQHSPNGLGQYLSVEPNACEVVEHGQIDGQSSAPNLTRLPSPGIHVQLHVDAYA
jgi:hypothetical protein